jgi:hypothetical protein
MRPLGKKQQSVLEALKRHKGWSYGCGWVWDSQGGTLRIMERLVARGDVIKTKVKGSRGETDMYHPKGTPCPK